MKKILFISNITKKITNFSYPSIVASRKLGYEFHLAANLSNFEYHSNSYNITLHHIDLNRNPFSLQNIKAYKQMVELIRKENFDVIHCNTPVGGVLGRLCGKKAKINKIIYSAHGFHFYKGAPVINNLLFKSVEKWLARYTDTIITMNQEDFLAAQMFNLKSKGNVYYIPGVGVDTKKFQHNHIDIKKKRKSLNLKQGDIVLISMGDLIKRKNYKSAIKALAEIDSDKIHYLICGEGPELNNLEKLAKKLGVLDRVHFLGFRNDIKELLAISDVFLFTTYQEGLPRSMMEAMSAGLPCIASNIRGNSDLIDGKNGGFLCYPDDKYEFAKAIKNIISDEELKNSMGVYNQEKIGNFDVDNIIEEMTKIYSKELL